MAGKSPLRAPPVRRASGSLCPFDPASFPTLTKSLHYAYCPLTFLKYYGLQWMIRILLDERQLDEFIVHGLQGLHQRDRSCRKLYVTFDVKAGETDTN